MNKKLLSILGYVAAVVFIVLSLVYFTHAANQLPHFLPGYDANLSRVHYKHGIALVALALAAAAFGWFQSGPSAAPEKLEK